MKNFLIVFLLIINCGVLAETEKFTRISNYNIDAVNPTAQTNSEGKIFPGFRGANQLIIYTPEFGTYTGTNEYGREATVIDGRVFSFNGANSFIPAGGYVISGHGKAKKWMNQNLIEGAFVDFNSSTKLLESLINPESYLYKAEHKLGEVQKVIVHYKKTLPGYRYTYAQKYYTASLDKLQEAKFHLSQKQYKKTVKDLNSSLLLSQKAFYFAIPSARGEFHGIWLRPTEKSRSEIARTLKKLKSTGIDNVFLETYYQGYTIFPSSIMEKYGLTCQRPEFQGWDPLKYWIKEAHERDMKIHVWFQTFYAGNQDVRKTPGHILFSYPEWANVQRKNAHEDLPMPSNSEHNGYFLDPANHRVQQFLLSLIEEITSNYKVDGINIDYIRYPKSLTAKTSGYLDSTWGYSEYAREDFEEKFGKDPLYITQNHKLWSKWIKYRQEKVTEFVSKLRHTINNPEITISAVIFPDLKETPVTKLQKWDDWAQKCHVDVFTPLIMSSDEVRARNSISEITGYAGGKVKIYAGLFEPFTEGSPSNLLKQIVAARKAGASGVVIFDYAHLDEHFADALRTRIFRN